MAIKAITSLARAALASLRRGWKMLAPFLQHLLMSLGIGIIAAIILHVARPYVPGLAGAETAATDWAIKFWEDRLDTVHPGDDRFVFIDIDEPTYRAWKDPLFAPREKLLPLIQFVLDAQAKLLVVDIELTKYAPRPTSPPSTPHPGIEPDNPDDALAAYLRRYSERFASAQKPMAIVPTPIILARTIRSRLRSGPSEPGQADGVRTDAIREERSSEFLEPIVAGSSVLHWGSPLSDRDDDGLVRNWRLLEATCLKDEPHAVPSMALLSWVLLRAPLLNSASSTPAAFKEELRRRFAPSRATCGPSSTPEALPVAASVSPWTLVDRVLGKPLVLSTKPSDLEQRIFYKFHPGTVLAGQFSRVSAKLITDSAPDQPVSRDWIRDAIVVIGSSYETGKDLHLTPIGEMPGALVVINQINALLEFGQFQELSRGIRWTGLLLLIAIFSLVFSFFTKAWGAQVSTFVINAILLPLSLWLFQYGWWLDLVFPLFVLQAYQKFVDLKVTPSPMIRRHGETHEHQ
ncbi:MAG: CHASE2 domain-containing protein [Nitrospira sp.]